MKPTSDDRPASLSIVHLNAHDRYGGAERLMCDLIAEQRAAGHRSLGLVGHKTRADSPTIAFDLDPDLTRRGELQRAGWPDYEFRGSHRLTSHPAIESAEIIHAHNLSGSYFHPLSLVALSHSRPLVWSIHDMQALTGYCSHSLGCERWEIGCGECPDLRRPGPRLEFDNTAALWRDKQVISENSRLFVVGASSWIVAKLQRSLLRRHPIHLIANGIDTKIFRSLDRLEMRRKLGLPEGALIVGSLAYGGALTHPWKGGEHLRAALAAVRAQHPAMLFLNLGANEPAAEPWIRAHAPASPAELCEWLGALDFFLHPAIADTAPLAVLEAMACGLPVIGFRIGGLPDMITETEGILVAEAGTQALCEAALQLANDAPLRARMSEASRQRAVTFFDRARMAAAYEKLYREILPACATGSRPKGAQDSALEEIHRLESVIVELERTLGEHRVRRKTLHAEIERLLDHRWTKMGMRLGLVRGALKKWLRREERERAKRQAKKANQ